MAIGKKLEELLKAKNKKPGTLASETGISKNTIYSIIKRDNEKVDLSIMEKIAESLDVSVDYFFYSTSSQEIPGALHITKRKIPLLGEIACGEPIYAQEDYNVYMEADNNVDCDFALRCKGDSMVGARIFDGDIVFVKKQEYVDDGSIAAVLIDDDATLKRIYHISDGRIELRAENPTFRPIIVGGPQETRNFRILGKAVGFYSNLV